MLRLGLRLSMVLACLCWLPILLIRLQPYNDGGLRAFLTTGECAAPCFLNIQPGRTAMRVADALLREQGWVERVEPGIDALNGLPGAIYWTWNGQQPAFFADSGRGSVRSFNGERVSEIQVELGLTLGDIWLSLGPPQSSATMIQGVNFPHISMAFVILYPEFAILGSSNCPYHAKFWHSPVTLRLRREAAFTGAFQPDQQPMARRVALLERAWCD
jgi:hypothetical protein